ncbi:DNA polymerase III subunit alpha [Candidatus Entotheonella palauensis]|uniref:DNA polymerase III subunit alpha n=1 Tax=Candidatus Entotheonella palauensis TaxID=93172 RepID=UPI000B7F8038|nr:DNA polymerase III subunit alpha [Candidatus Entotheonella palauensis]
MREARVRGIRSQGRGSAANSIVAYLLRITNIDPLAHNLLFERFLSEDKFTAPDIDLDFAADRREEIIQYVYETYGAAHTAMVCNVNTFKARSAVRDLGKALDFPQDVIDRLAKGLDTHAPAAAAEQLAETPPLRLLSDLLVQIDGCPRHLSIHSGGMLITGSPLHDVVPLEPATMPGRVVVQWDKDGCEDAGLIKIDLLGLRTLGLVTEALGYIENPPDVDLLPLDDPHVYSKLQQGDTIGAFQVESRAQQQMLPRLKPTCFEDIAVQVAIVRPGPIQGGAVHPYLRRRAGAEEVDYLHPCLEPVLAETKGVLLFQEQAIRVAVVAGGFSPGEADLLRRALSRKNADEAVAAMKGRFLQGATAQGIEPKITGEIFKQLAGFAGYGFCKSHAMSFALIAYQTMWLKCYHPTAFACGLLNQQPMGFYSPAVIVGDARRHGVQLLPPDINQSEWAYTIEGQGRIRTGLRAVKGLGEASVQRIVEARPFQGLHDFCRRTRLNQDVVSQLIRAGALDRFGARRQLLWALGTIDYRPLDLSTAAVEVDLPRLEGLEQMVWEYEILGLSPDGQIMQPYREQLRKAGILSTWQVKQEGAGKRVRVAGMAVIRQRPATAGGILFISLEDESSLLDLVVKPAVYQRLRSVLRHESLMIVEGIVQRAGQAVSLLVSGAWPMR